MNRPTNQFVRKRVAIVGSGSAGIGALWALNRTYHDVYLYEGADRLGGHVNTVQWEIGRYKTAVDTGFIVLNTATHSNFITVLNKIGVETDPIQMTLGVSRDRGTFEWASANLRALFCQRRNVLSLRMWRLLFEIVRFNHFALDLLVEEDHQHNHIRNGMDQIDTDETIGEYLEREDYSDSFRDDYLIPLVAALWSTSSLNSVLGFPATMLVRALWNHHLLSIGPSRPQWLSLRNGTKSYVDAVMRGFPPNHRFMKTSVRHVSPSSDGRVRIHLENGSSEIYDHVILATHADQALEILGSSATALERSVLSCFKTSQNEAVLHSDSSLMPVRRRAWSALNYLTASPSNSSRAKSDQASLTYNMNILQNIPRDTFGDILVTLNPTYKSRPEKIQGRYYYSNPVYTTSTIRAQRSLRSIQNKRGISFAGAWTKFGFHEDGFSSGLYVAKEHLGAKLPFEFQDSTISRGTKPRLGFVDLVIRLIILIVRVFIIQISERLVGAGKRKIKPLANGINGRKINGKYS